MSTTPPLLFLLELSPYVASGLQASGALAGLGFIIDGFSRAQVVMLSHVFWRRVDEHQQG